MAKLTDPEIIQALKDSKPIYMKSRDEYFTQTCGCIFRCDSKGNPEWHRPNANLCYFEYLTTDDWEIVPDEA